MFRSLLSAVRSFGREETALTATEYAIMLSLVVVVVVTAIPTAGYNLRAAFVQALPDAGPDVILISRNTMLQAS